MGMINKIILGDCLDVMKKIPDEKIDLIITDPPYPRQYLPMFEVLFREGSRILKDKGNLITLCGHYQLPEVLDYGRQYMRYWWVFWMKQSRLNRLIGKGVTVLGKPAVWFVKNARRDQKVYKFPFDTLDSNLKNDKESKILHKWGQDYLWFQHYICELTLPREIVLDPFIGSGSTAIACINTDRRFIGIEKDEKYWEIANQRINEALNGIMAG